MVINSVPFPVSFWAILYVNMAAVSANLCVSANIRRKAVIVINSVPFPVSFWAILNVNTAAVSANLSLSANISPSNLHKYSAEH